MYNQEVILIFGAILALSNSAAVYKKFSSKCALGDSECFRLLYKSVIDEVGDNGIPEYGIPKADPYEVKDVELLALGMIKVTLKDGALAGLKSCKSNSFTTDAKTLHTSIELVCDLFTFEGHFAAEPSPTLSALLGGIHIHGDGKAKLDIEQLKLNLGFPYEVKKLDDGELHLIPITDEITSSFEILGKATLDADGIFIGKQDISTVAVNIFNENWQVISKVLGSTITDGVMKIFFKHFNKFFESVPAKDLVLDDLSSFVK